MPRGGVSTHERLGSVRFCFPGHGLGRQSRRCDGRCQTLQPPTLVPFPSRQDTRLVAMPFPQVTEHCGGKNKIKMIRLVSFNAVFYSFFRKVLNFGRESVFLMVLSRLLKSFEAW